MKRRSRRQGTRLDAPAARLWTWCEAHQKRAYPSAKVAMRAHRTSGERLRPYRCPSCNRWHVTSKRTIR